MMVNEINSQANIKIQQNIFYEDLKRKREELLSLIKLNKSSKGWLEKFDTVTNLNDLITFYEDQKVTFSQKKNSYARNMYFFSFILAFLKFYPRLTDRSIEALGNLLKYLYNLDRDLFNLIWTNLPFDLKHRITKKMSYKIKVLFINSLPEVIDFYEDLRKKLSKSYMREEEIVGILISIFEKVIEFHNEWDDFSEEKIYFTLLSLERNILHYSKKYNLNIDFDVKKYLQKEDYKKYVKFSISFNKGISKWQDFFNFLSFDELIDFYNKQKATFSRKSKIKDVLFFQEFIKAFAKYKDINTEQAISKLQILIRWYSKFDGNYKDFLKSINLNYDEIVSFSKKNASSKSVSTKKEVDKVKQLPKDEMKSKNKLNSVFIRDLKIIITNLKNKSGKNLEGKSWYDVGVERLKKYLEHNSSIGKQDFENLILLLNIDDLYSIHNFWPDSKKLKRMILEKTFDGVNILFLSDKYYPVLAKLLKEIVKVKNFNKNSELAKKIFLSLDKRSDLKKFLERKYPKLISILFK